MVTTPSHQVADDARAVFGQPDLPPLFAFVDRLSPLHQRLFIRDLWSATSRVSVTPTDSALRALVSLIEEWEATSDLDAAPEVAAEIRAPKSYRPVDLD